ncbi:MAG TPA: OmpH family outer membrane protein [Stellaceae bacterium]|nr:OmpH family outer membrane protein [Stellaceae bacterium]
MALALPLACAVVASAAAQAPPKSPPVPAAPAPAPAAPAPAAPAPVAALPSGQNLNIMVVDVQALLQNSKAAKMVRGQIEQKRAEYTKEISHEEEVLRAQRDALQRQQSSMTPEALNKKGREFQQRVNDLDRNVQGKRQALEKSNNEALSKIQQEMLKIIADIAKQRKANLVFQRTDLVLFDRGFDVTDEVMQKLDEQMPVLNVTFVTPAAPSAAPASSTAAAKPTSSKSKRK